MHSLFVTTIPMLGHDESYLPKLQNSYNKALNLFSGFLRETMINVTVILKIKTKKPQSKSAGSLSSYRLLKVLQIIPKCYLFSFSIFTLFTVSCDKKPKHCIYPREHKLHRCKLS